MLFSFSVVYASSKSDLNLQYSKALQAYKAKNFGTSYEIFSKLYLSRLSDAKLNFYFGRSAYETGHYEVALAAFERVEMLDPGNLRNRLEMARIYYMLKMYEDAELAFKEVLANPNIPQNVRTNIELYLSRATKAQKKSFTYATVNLDFLYDSNVNYGSLGDFEYGGFSFPAAKIKSDMAFQAYADVVNVYDIGDKNGFAIKNRLSGFGKKYLVENDYDIIYIGYTPSLVYKNTKNIFEFLVGFDDLQIGVDDYLHSIYISPRYEYSHTTTLRSIAYFKYQQKYFQRETEHNLNADHFELAYGVQKILSPSSYIQGNLVGTNETKHHGARVDVDYNEYKLNLLYADQFTTIFGTEFYGEYRKRDYIDFSIGFDSTRVDNAGLLGVNLNMKILETLRGHLKATYNRVESNQERYSYEKYTITLGLNKTF